jgi:hypothetical protein
MEIPERRTNPMANKNEQTPYERALTRAAQDGVQVERDYGDHSALMA